MLLDEQHRAAVIVGDPVHGLEQRLHDQRREAHAHLVDEQHLGLLDQRACHGEHLLLATRERAGAQRPALLERREHVEHVAR